MVLNVESTDQYAVKYRLHLKLDVIVKDVNHV